MMTTRPTTQVACLAPMDHPQPWGENILSQPATAHTLQGTQVS